MRRIYILNGFEESRETFLRALGDVPSSAIRVLAEGKILEKNGNRFQIRNFNGL